MNDELRAAVERVRSAYNMGNTDIRDRNMIVRAYFSDHDETQQLLIEIRKYVVYHGIMIGECVAWNKLKEMYEVGNEGLEKI